MKKLGILLIAMVLTFALFAEDGEVLPQGVFRFTNALSYNSTDKIFDKDGKSFDTNEVSVASLSFGLEYGIVDWVSCGIQWAPAWNFYSDVKVIDKTSPFKKVKVVPTGGWFTGAKFQILGEQGLVLSENMRFAVTTGLFIPASYSVKEQTKNAMKGDHFLYPCDCPAFMIGGRTHFDYIFPKFFDINLTTEFMKKLTIDADKDLAASANNAMAAMNAPGVKAVKEVDYGYHYSLQLNPHFGMNLTDRVSFGLTTPLTYAYKSEVKWDDKKIYDSVKSFTAAFSTGISVDFLDATLPFELSLDYNMNVLGKNTSNSKLLTLTFTPYFAF